MTQEQFHGKLSGVFGHFETTTQDTLISERADTGLEITTRACQQCRPLVRGAGETRSPLRRMSPAPRTGGQRCSLSKSTPEYSSPPPHTPEERHLHLLLYRIQLKRSRQLEADSIPFALSLEYKSRTQ
jgi:hypothetical protein